jgi:hypothetical protein
MDDYISNKKLIFCGWSRNILQVKVRATQDLKAEAEEHLNLQEKLHLQDLEEINLIATHPREIVP